MEQPDIQQVIVVDANGIPFSTYELKEAAELVFDPADGISRDELTDTAFELVRPAMFNFEERRSQYDWGATGPIVQELLIQFGGATAAGLTIDGIVAVLRKLSRRGSDGTTRKDFVAAVVSVTDAEAAWSLFAHFMEKAFKVSSARALEVRDTDNEWHIRATGDGYHYEGTVSKDGQLKYARRIDS